MRRILFQSHFTFLLGIIPFWHCYGEIALVSKCSLWALYLISFLSGHELDYICFFWDSLAIHQYYTLQKYICHMIASIFWISHFNNEVSIDILIIKFNLFALKSAENFLFAFWFNENFIRKIQKNISNEFFNFSKKNSKIFSFLLKLSLKKIEFEKSYRHFEHRSKLKRKKIKMIFIFEFFFRSLCFFNFLFVNFLAVSSFARFKLTKKLI